ncbi:NUDIX domain-containing protein [Pelagibacterales bacterium SAG-MED33]|nr:NUDIX domain-containing protein [Pelagibacterales bacterium SAG-MED33]
MKSKFFNSWKKVIKTNKNKIINSKIIGKVDRGNNDEKLSVLDAEIETNKGDRLSRAIILESPSVVVVPVLKLLNKKKFIVIKQFRISQGKETIEFPAGAIKNNQKIQSALDEIKEEINIKINKKDLKKLHNRPIMMMPSYNSCLAYFYYFEKNVDNNTLNKLNNSITGQRNLGEKIKVKVIDEDKIKKINTSSVVIGLSLYERLKK